MAEKPELDTILRKMITIAEALELIKIADLKITLAERAIKGDKPCSEYRASKEQHVILNQDPLWGKYPFPWEERLSSAHIDRGMANEALRDYKAALQDYNHAVCADDTNDQAYYYRGVLRANEGDLQGAVEDLTEAISIDNKEPDYHYALAQVYAWLGYSSEAIKSFTKAIKLKPEAKYIYHDRAKVYEKMGQKKASTKRPVHS